MKLSRAIPPLIPTILVIVSDTAIAQSIQQQPTQQTAPPPTAHDPLTTYGVIAALLLSGGKVVIDTFKTYTDNLSKRSEIETKAQESEHKRIQDMTLMVMKQQETLVQHLQTSQVEGGKQLLALFQEISKMASAIESLTEELKRSQNK